MGKEALEMIRRDYYLPQAKLYSEKPDKKQPAFNWGVGVVLSALNAATKYDPRYKPWLKEYADRTIAYWNDGGYDVLPGPKKKDRYYDDNAWMALSLLETYKVLGQKKYLTWSKRALEFALKGLAKDGGIYWREADHASRNTCACAPTATACLLMADTDTPGGGRYRRLGKEIAEWTKSHLRNPDGLYYDSLSNSGKIEKTLWTYNTALMIRAEDLLAMPVDKASPSAAAAVKQWMPDGEHIADPGRFAHLLFEALVWHNGVDPSYVKVLQNVRNARNENGHYPVDWKDLKVARNPEILDQAAFARACFVLANAMRN